MTVSETIADIKVRAVMYEDVHVQSRDLLTLVTAFERQRAALEHYADKDRWYLGMGNEYTTYHNEANRKIRHGYLVAREALKED